MLHPSAVGISRFEELERRRLLSASFRFSTGDPDGKIATIVAPSSSRTDDVEFETGDDFVLTRDTTLRQATFTGLLTGGATASDISDVIVEIYRVFPKDSNVERTSGPPTFSTEKVPTRVNSPSDVAFESRDSASDELDFETAVLSASFSAAASVSTPESIAVQSGGDGPVSGTEVRIEVAFGSHPFFLPADHYFFVPQVGLSESAPSDANFLWLSAPKPITGNRTTPFTPDLQSWMRDDPPLAPDWLRIGTDIIGGNPAPTFNASFSLHGTVKPEAARGHEPDSAASSAASVGLPSGLLSIIDDVG
jgi:hypothetical protein